MQNFKLILGLQYYKFQIFSNICIFFISPLQACILSCPVVVPLSLTASISDTSHLSLCYATFHFVSKDNFQFQLTHLLLMRVLILAPITFHH